MTAVLRPRARALITGVAATGAVLAGLGAPAVAAAPVPAVALPTIATSPDFRPHPSLVPQTPARGYPVISSLPTIPQTNNNCPEGCDVPREVLGTDQVGRYIVSGGNFLSVELQDGTSIDQPYFTAWNIDTKAIACTSTTFDSPVLKVLPGGDPETVYVAGRFAKINGPGGVTRTRPKIAKLDLSDCSVDKTFTSPAPNGKIDELALVGDRLFVGGDFSTIGGQVISTVAELDARTGQVRPDFSLSFSGGLSSRLRGMAVTKDGTRLVMAGRFGTVTQGGTSVTMPTAVLDITGASPRLTPHSSTGYTTTRGAAMPMRALQDASIAPDGNGVGLAFGTGTIYDYVYYAPLAESDGNRYTWRHYMRDSSFGVGVSNNAVYVTGHFCQPEGGPGPSALLAPVAGITSNCTGSQIGGGVWRSKIAALSPTDGTPLDWNPGNGSFRGGQVITVTSRGLLVGFDGERTAGVRTGALSFLDLGVEAEDAAAPSEVTLVSPEEGASVGDLVLVEGSATDDVAVAAYLLTVRSSDGRYLQADGSLGTSPAERRVEAGEDGSLRTELALSAGTWTLGVTAVDVAGTRSARATTRTVTQDGVDRRGPDVTVVAPRTLDVGQPLTIDGTARDSGGVDTVKPRVRAADGRWLSTDGTFSSSVSNLPVTTDVALPAPLVTYSADLDVSLPAGTHTVMTRVLDVAGNATTAYQDVMVAPVAPEVSITSPGPEVDAGQPVQVAGRVGDAGRVAGVEVVLVDEAGTFLQPGGSFTAARTVLPATLTGVGTASVEYTYRAPALPAGRYTVTVTGRDASGETTATEQPFTVRAPAVAGIAAYDGGSATRDAGTVGYTFRVDGARTLTRIGIQDTDGNGRLDNGSSVRAGVWRQGSSTALATVTLPAGATATDGWAWADLTDGLRLEPGVTYVAGQEVLGNGEAFFRSGTPTTADGLSITGRATYLPWFGAGYRYPSSQSTGSTPYGVPNLWLQP